jgi:RNA polymerase sigma-70 factor, ECF subfamily
MDPDTISRAAAGDTGALDEIFRRNLGPLVAFIRMKAGGIVTANETPMDLAQSVCREVLQDFDQFEAAGEVAFRSWLFLHATRKIASRYRYHKRDKRDVGRAVPLADHEAKTLIETYRGVATPSRYATSKEEVDRIEDAIRKLPEDQRDAVMMAKMMNLDYSEIARQMTRSESSVRGLVARGLAVLAASLST